MKNILNGILGLFIGYIPTAYAGLPPTTVKGQSETTPTTTFNIQTPYNAATTSASGTRYIDSGNRNVLLNSSFEATTATTSWTATTATGASESTVVTDGKKSYKLSFTASTGDVTQSVTPAIQMQGLNLEATCKVKTTLTTIQVCALAAGAEIQCSNVSPSYWGTYAVNFPGPSSGSVGVKVKTSSSTTGDAYIDDCYVGPARNTGVANNSTDWASYTPALTSFGTVGSVEFQWRREGPDLLIRGKFQGGTPVASEARFEFPTGLVSAGTASIPTIQKAGNIVFSAAVSGGAEWTALIEPNVSYFTWGAENTSSGGLTKVTAAGTGFGTAVYYSIQARAPIAGWQAQSAIAVDQANYDWTPYTPTLGAGYGTTTNSSFLQRREGSNLVVRGTFTTGTVAASISSISLPGSLTIDSSKITLLNTTAANGPAIGTYTQNGSANAGPIVLAYNTSSSSVYLGGLYSGTGNNNPQNVNSVISSTQPIAIQFSVPILGWSANQNAPLLVGSVTSNSSGTERIERARITNTGSPTVTSQSGSWITSLAFPGTGFVDITIATGIFSAAPSCNITMWATATYGYFASIPVTPTATLIKTAMIAYTGVASNEPFEIVCMGPR